MSLGEGSTYISGGTAVGAVEVESAFLLHKRSLSSPGLRSEK